VQVIQNSCLIFRYGPPALIFAHVLPMACKKDGGVSIQPPPDPRIQHKSKLAGDGLIRQTKSGAWQVLSSG
jgi:hypothetical protein